MQHYKKISSYDFFLCTLEHERVTARFWQWNVCLSPRLYKSEFYIFLTYLAFYSTFWETGTMRSLIEATLEPCDYHLKESLMKSISEEAAKLWSKDHIRDVLETVIQDLEDFEFDLSQESNDHSRDIMKEKISDLREERNFLTSLLKD